MREIRPVGYGMSGYPWSIASRYSLSHPSASAKCWLGGSNPSPRTLRDGSLLAIIPGNKIAWLQSNGPPGQDKPDAAPRFNGMWNRRQHYG
jgi:hypothetical protein